jgi:GNAT superfamily N-acetyltransferase
MILECKTPDAIRATFLTMQQLRPHLTDPEAYGALVQQMQTDHGFRLIGFFQDNDCLGVAGFKVETMLFNGKMLYLADLVLKEHKRSTGVGKALIDWLETEAKRLDCQDFILDSDVDRIAAHKFYFREGFHITAFNFRRAVL